MKRKRNIYLLIVDFSLLNYYIELLIKIIMAFNDIVKGGYPQSKYNFPRYNLGTRRFFALLLASSFVTGIFWQTIWVKPKILEKHPKKENE